MTSFWAGIIAGFVATVALSVMMAMKQQMKIMPQMDMIGMIGGMMGGSRTMGWLVHFIVGSIIYGLAYAWVFAPLWPGAYWLSGLVLGAVGWLIAGLTMMPMAHNGLFGVKLGAPVPWASLMMHLIFGVVLGAIYGVLAPAT